MATPMPVEAPEPARPTKCPDPILLANRDAPTCMKVNIRYKSLV